MRTSDSASSLLLTADHHNIPSTNLSNLVHQTTVRSLKPLIANEDDFVVLGVENVWRGGVTLVDGKERDKVVSDESWVCMQFSCKVSYGIQI